MRKRPLANLLYHIDRLENLLVNQRLSSINLRVTHVHALRYIRKHPGYIQKEVAECLFYQPASFTNVIKLLEKKQMVGRRPDPKNSLKRQLFLLPAGKGVLDQVNQTFKGVNQLVGTVNSDTLARLEEISDNLERQVQRRLKNK